MPEIDWATISIHTDVAGNPLWKWAAALGTLVVVWLVIRIVLGFTRRRAKKLAEKARARVFYLLLDVVARTRSWFLFVLAVYVGARWIALSEGAWAVLRGVFVVVAWFQVGLWLVGVLQFVIDRVLREKAEDDPARLTSLVALTWMGRLVVWAFVLLMSLDNLGIQITALIAGLGVGGIAVALAAQNILSDLFSSLSIVFDRPFQVGDFIIVGDFLGTVEYIGLKTTRLRSLGGEQLVFGNSDLLGSRIRNYKRMSERRVVFGFGVVYQTPYEKLERIPRMVREAIEAQPKTRFDRAHFKAFGASSLDFEVVYFMLVPDYPVYMDTQQAINLALYKGFEDEGIDFAYPTQTLYVHGEGKEARPGTGVG